MTPPKGVKVHAVCKACGTTVDTVAEKGRVTWRGPCPGEGCNRKVVAHRVKPGDAPPAPVNDDDKPARRRARKGTYDDSGSVEPPARRRPPGRRDGDTRPPPEPAGTGEPTGDNEPPAPPRRAERRTGRAEPDDDRLLAALDIF